MTKKYSLEDLIARLKSPGWRLVTGQPHKTVTGTLEDLLKTAHGQKAKEQTLIQQVETSVELDMIQIELLWRYLGLPTI